VKIATGSARRCPGHPRRGHGFDRRRRRRARRSPPPGIQAIVLPGVHCCRRPPAAGSPTTRATGGAVLPCGRKPRGRVPSLTGERRRALDAARPRGPCGPDADAFHTAVGFRPSTACRMPTCTLANSGNLPVTVSGPFRAATPYPERWDPLTGRVERLPSRDGEIALQFEPYGSRWWCSGNTPAPRRRRAPRRSASEDLRSGWSVSSVSPVRRHRRSPALLASTRPRFSLGTASYRLRVKPPARFALRDASNLDFGEAKASSARQWPAERCVGTPSPRSWPRPSVRRPPSSSTAARGLAVGAAYRLDVTDLLRDGRTRSGSDVYNTRSNQLARRTAAGHEAVVERYGLGLGCRTSTAAALPQAFFRTPRLVLER